MRLGRKVRELRRELHKGIISRRTLHKYVKAPNYAGVVILREECAYCKKTEDLVLHHVSYQPEVVVMLCRECHAKVHYTIPHPERPPKFRKKVKVVFEL